MAGGGEGEGGFEGRDRGTEGRRDAPIVEV